MILSDSKKWALVIPLANEEKDLLELLRRVTLILDTHAGGHVFLVIDNASRDKTHEMASNFDDPRFEVLWAPENRNVVDAYIRGYREAYDRGFSLIIEMDGGLSHLPEQIPQFLDELNQGMQVVYGCRNCPGGSFGNSTLIRRFYSLVGTYLSNILLGLSFRDGTSGFIGMNRKALAQFAHKNFLSNGHFYQTELRYYLKGYRYKEIPITYDSPSPRVSSMSIRNALYVLGLLCIGRIKRKIT
jgi:dolichol-phosphate mannosyltransferase